MSDNSSENQTQNDGSHRGGVIGALVLITIGVVFLLSNLGYISSSVWLILIQFWPLILILAGIELLFGRSRYGQLIVLVIGLLMLGGVVWILINPTSLSFVGSQTTETIAEPAAGITMAELELSPGVGELNLTPLASGSPNWLEGTIALASGQRLEQQSSTAGSTAQLKLDTEGTVFFFGSGERWNLALSPQIPIALKVDAGVGSSTIDLNALNTPRLDLDTGVGSMQVTMPSHAGTVIARVNGGVGGLTLLIPQGIPARIRADSGIGFVNVNQTRFPNVGENLYESPDYATATDRIDLTIDSGVGGITIP